MKTPSSPALFGFILLVLAAVFLGFTRHDGDPARNDLATPSAHRNPGVPPRGAMPADSGTSSKQATEKAPLLLTADGLAEFSNYDRNGDGDPEIDAFLEVYRRVGTSAGRIDMLENVRTFHTLDEPQLNDLLIEQAAKADDPEVRRAARDALLDHGGAKAHDSLAAYLKSETRAADLHELEKLLEDLKRTPLRLARSGAQGRPTSTSPPETNN